MARIFQSAVPVAASVVAILFALSAQAGTTQLLATCTAPQPEIASAWPDTDFARCTAPLGEVISGGPPKDGIPPIDSPLFVSLPELARTADFTVEPREPVIELTLDGVTRAYPLSVLMWHEIVNDEIAGVPVAVTYCPLCNTAIAFDRRLETGSGVTVLDFGTTGKLRNSDLIMYDRQTESWWQQYDGSGLFGALADRRLTILASRLVSFAEFASRHPQAEILVPSGRHQRRYGANPYVGYDSSQFPFLFSGEVPPGIAPLARVVVVGDRAWSLTHLKNHREIVSDGLTIRWRPGQASALDTRQIADGRDVGTVSVTGPTGDVPYKVTFAFVWHAFNPGAPIIGLEK